MPQQSLRRLYKRHPWHWLLTQSAFSGTSLLVSAIKVELPSRCPASKASSSAKPLNAPLSVLPSVRPLNAHPNAHQSVPPSALPRLPALLQSLPAVALALEDAAALGDAVGPALGGAAALAPGVAAASFPITGDPTDAGTRGLTAVTVAVGTANSLGAAVAALGAAADHLAFFTPRRSYVEPKANDPTQACSCPPSSFAFHLPEMFFVDLILQKPSLTVFLVPVWPQFHCLLSCGH
ncbi:uncharacterized protein LOC114042943 [Vombatus ursinus]|uniref:uncharacterized protein LOC114042943 n=1 Tax=Vombatus ursinus TaxID=29139 RepID=UPI000FFCFF20|nr:uncharacterized protein LOC114042943 [Vombatus ursinus]